MESPLRQFRREKGLSMAALARELGVSGATICRWENGKRGPRRRDIPSIMEKTGLTAAELLCLSEHTTEPEAS